MYADIHLDLIQPSPFIHAWLIDNHRESPFPILLRQSLYFNSPRHPGYVGHVHVVRVFVKTLRSITSRTVS